MAVFNREPAQYYKSSTSRRLMYSGDVMDSNLNDRNICLKYDCNTLKQDNTICNSNTINNLFQDDSPDCKLISQDNQMYYERYRNYSSTVQTDFISSAFTEEDMQKT